MLAEELPELVESIAVDLAAGASRDSSGAKWAKSPKLSTDADRVTAFRALRIGQDETLGAEASSPLGLGLESKAAAVAVAAFSGAGGGLPRPVAAALGSLRGLTSVGRLAARVGSGILRRLL